MCSSNTFQSLQIPLIKIKKTHQQFCISTFSTEEYARIHLNIFIYVLRMEKMSSGFETTWGWVNDFILIWTNPSIPHLILHIFDFLWANCQHTATYLFEFSIPVGFESIRSMQLNGGVTYNFNTTFLIFSTQWPHSTIHLSNRSQVNIFNHNFDYLNVSNKLQHTPTGSFWLLEGFFGGWRRGVLPFL